MDPLIVVVAVGIFEYYDFEQVIVYAVVVVVDGIESLLYMAAAVDVVGAGVEYVVDDDDHSIVLHKSVPNKFPDHWIIVHYYVRIMID
jgi:uncharacterized protein YlxW (UPF0749 family)